MNPAKQKQFQVPYKKVDDKAAEKTLKRRKEMQTKKFGL